MMTCLHAYDRNVMDDVYLEIGFLTSYRTGRFLKIYENKASSIVSLQFDDICRSTLKVRTALLFTPCTKAISDFPEQPAQRKADCSAARSKRGFPRPQGDARGVATACRSKGGCDKRFINKNNGNAAEQGGVVTASRSKGFATKVS